MFLTTMFLSATEQSISQIAIAETKNIKQDSVECDEKCLQELLERKDIFTFLSKVSNDIKDDKLKEARDKLQIAFNIDNKNIENNNSFKVAMILPEKAIGFYALSTSKSVFLYLVSRGKNFIVKNYFIKDESESAINSALDSIIKDGYRYIIAPVTSAGATIIEKTVPVFQIQQSQLQIFLPTINSIERKTENENILYGGIDYRVQISELLKNFDGNKITLFYDKSKKGDELNSEVVSQLQAGFPNSSIIQQVAINKDKSDFSSSLKKDIKTANETTVFINTTVKKSASLLTQMTSKNYIPKIILSTQNNYSPTLISMTKENDRTNLYIANSIPVNIDKQVTNINSLFSNDIFFNWINYATIVGLDYLYNQVTGEKKLFDENIIDGQVLYDVKIMKVIDSKFEDVETVDSKKITTK